MTWTYGRDGSLTGRRDGLWLGGTSMPRLVGLSMMSDVTADANGAGSSIALVAPNTLGHVVALLGKLPAGGSLSVVWPDDDAMLRALSCGDVSEDIVAGRLLCFSGLSGIVSTAHGRPGWAVPTTLHLAADTEAVQGPSVKALLQETKAALEEASTYRQAAVQAAGCSTRAVDGKTLVVAASGGALWADAGERLAACLGGKRLDPYDPKTASTLFLTDAAAAASSVVLCDVTRNDIGDWMPATPIISWISRDRAPVPSRATGDGLVLADAAWVPAWVAAGWSPDRVTVAGWPHLTEASGDSGVLLAWEAREPTPPESVKQYSSLGTIWACISAELADEPFAVTAAGGAAGYLTKRLSAANIALVDVDAAMWIERLVTPAFARGIALAARWCKGVTVVTSATLNELKALAERHAAVIDPTPNGLAAISSLGLPIIAARRCDAATFSSRIAAADGEMSHSGDLKLAVQSLLPGCGELIARAA